MSATSPPARPVSSIQLVARDEAGIENSAFELDSHNKQRASSEPAGGYSEALSSLLWEPYECRTRSSSTTSSKTGVEAATPHRDPQTPQQCSICVQCGQCSDMRTFTSTEAQTDDIPQQQQQQRRRRERLNVQTQVAETPPPDRLPDLLNSHLPPPYSTLPIAIPVPVQPHPAGVRFPFHINPTSRRSAGLVDRIKDVTEISRRSPRGQHYTPEEEPKTCCGVIVNQTVSIRWFIVMIAFVGICCAVVGTVLGAMKASGREHLTVSLLMIGVGIVLITVSGVAWRLTAHDAPSCRMMLGLGGGEEGCAEPNRRFVPRLPPSYGRPHHPYAAMMYPEFQYRPPPPSYQASMQEYRLRLLLLDRQPGTVASGQAPGGHTVSPPPTYRSHAGSILRAPLAVRRDVAQSDYSRPPSYRSRTSSSRPTLDPNGNTSCSTAEHSRDPSLSLSESGAVVNVISVMPDPEPLKLASLPSEADMPLRMKEGNLVTIVQTDSSPVIVTVSGSTSTTTQPPDTEVEILAHL